MKSLVAVVFLFVSGVIIEESDSKQVGSICSQNPVFNVTSFIVDQWPIVKAQTFAFNMTGTFTTIDNVNRVSIGTNYNGRDWNYTNEYINKNYNQGQVVSFDYTSDAGKIIGNYRVQITVESSSRQILSCWEFDYFLL